MGSSSQLFALGRYFLLEYSYTDPISPEIIETDESGFRKIENLHKGYNQFTNDNNSKKSTGNVIDTSTVKLDNGKHALLDVDSAFFYPNTDDKVNVIDLIISPVLQVEYDTVRVWMLSGYNFPDNDGFLVDLDIRTSNDNVIKILSQSFLKNNMRDVIFAPRPLKTSEFIYDRYVEFKVPSQRTMLEDQKNNPGSTTTLSYYMTGDEGIADINTIYVDFSIIRKSEEIEGSIYLTPDENQRFAINSIDDFANLVPVIEEADDGDYYRYYGSWNGASIENFMFSINSISGNDFILIHEISISEQIGIAHIPTDTFSIIQDRNYSDPKEFIPIIKNPDAVSYSIDYTIRLFNRADGRSIFRTSSITSFDTSKYGKRRVKLNVGGSNVTPHNIYNKIVQAERPVIKDLGAKVVKTKFISNFVDTEDIFIDTEDTDFDTSLPRNEVNLSLDPFDNVYRFNVLRKSDDGDINPIDLGDDTYYFVFINDDNGKMKVEEVTNTQRGHQNGELVFKINEARSTEISTQDSDKYYVVSSNSEGEETTLFYGKIIKTSK